MHTIAFRPSAVPQRVALPTPPASSLRDVPDPESDLARTASPTVTRLLATLVTDPSFESTTASALVTELADFAVTRRLDYVASLVTDLSSSISRPLYLVLVSMLLCLEGDPDALDIPTRHSYAKVITSEYSSQWQMAMDAEMASWKSTGTYVDEVPPPGANIVDGMWIFIVKRPPGSPPAFKARYVARGFRQRQGVDFFQTFSPTSKMTTLRVLHEEIWLRRPPGFTGLIPKATQWSLRRPVYGLRQAPSEWHDTLRITLAALGFAPSTADTSLFLRTDPSLPPLYILVYVDDLVFATADIEALTLVKAELHKRHTTDLGPSALRLQVLLATVHSSAYRPLALGSTFVEVLHRAWGSCLEDGVQWYLQDTPTLLRPTTSCEAKICAGAMAAHELHWLTYLLTDLGERPRSPPILYCGQLRLAYVASRANTADVFTEALRSGTADCFIGALILVARLLFVRYVTPCSS
ncbi:unnamed protein product [Closterium sp. NIES-53]